MPLRIVANRPDPAVVRLPWHLPLEDWGDDVLVPLPQGISRHVVRIATAGSQVVAVKQTREPIAFREHAMLRNLRRLSMPVVEPYGVVTGRETRDRQPIEAALITVFLPYSLPYRSLFSHGVPTENLPRIVDALVVLLVRLHLAGFFWGDVSLSNVLFRRSAGEFAAYVVDAETGELHDTLSDGQRAHDMQIATANVFGELLDLQAGGLIGDEVDPWQIVELLEERYAALWAELTSEEQFTTEEMWRIDRRVERLNELGFDVEELDIVTDWDGATVSLTPRVVEAGHHARELQRLTGLEVEENQARRLLNDLSSHASYLGPGADQRAVMAHRWLTTVFEPVWQLVPPELRVKLEQAEVFHEILEHRWLLSERRGHEVEILEAARDYVDTQLGGRPDEAVSAPVGEPSTD